ncbi:MAG TPA: DUF1289 domain-containing protein [Terriglobales bacterium]|nr:DUF1289 domain-containing protein [Terriglobales bacterium]
MKISVASFPAPTTPCIGVCTMEHDHCRGCQRTLAEIAAWSRLPEAERQRIVREVLPLRRAAAPACNPQSR